MEFYEVLQIPEPVLPTYNGNLVHNRMPMTLSLFLHLEHARKWEPRVFKSFKILSRTVVDIAEPSEPSTGNLVHLSSLSAACFRSIDSRCEVKNTELFNGRRWVGDLMILSPY